MSPPPRQRPQFSKVRPNTSRVENREHIQWGKRVSKGLVGNPGIINFALLTLRTNWASRVPCLVWNQRPANFLERARWLTSFGEHAMCVVAMQLHFQSTNASWMARDWMWLCFSTPLLTEMVVGWNCMTLSGVPWGRWKAVMTLTMELSQLGRRPFAPCHFLSPHSLCPQGVNFILVHGNSKTKASFPAGAQQRSSTARWL